MDSNQRYAYTNNPARPAYRNGNNMDSERIIKAVNRYGCLSLEQAFYFLPERSKVDIDKMATFFRDSKQCSLNGNMLVAKGTAITKCQAIIDCVWALIDLTDRNLTEGDIADELQTNSYMGEAPVQITAVIGSSKLANFISVEKESDIMQVLFAQEKFYANGHIRGKEDESTSVYYAVTRSYELLAKLKMKQFTFPITAILLTNEDGNEEPVAEYIDLK